MPDPLEVVGAVEAAPIQPLTRPSPEEETIYVTPASAAQSDQARIVQAVADVARAIGLRHGPIHAECRVSPNRVVVLEIAARPIGGLCARALRFLGERSQTFAYEEVLLRHAIGESAMFASRPRRRC